jgi:sugar lactone lactonase YvrE
MQQQPAHTHLKQVLFAALLLLAGSAAAAPPAGCRHVTLTDQASGAPIKGIEDLAIDRRTGAAWLAAQDRSVSPSQPGGLYRLSGEARRRAFEDKRAALQALQGDLGFPFHPHGLALGPSPLGDTLWVINHRDRPAATTVELVRLGADGPMHGATIADDRLCAANDLVITPNRRVFLSRDHDSCTTAGIWAENILGFERASVVEIEPPAGLAAPQIRTVLENLAFANGLAVDAGILYIALTRADEIGAYSLADLGRLPSPAAVRRIALPGAPDNLSMAADGRLLAALHPSLLRLAWHRAGWFGGASAPGLAVAIAPGSATPAVIYDDPEGALLPAVTVAARIGTDLLLGSATGAGLVICRDGLKP